MSSRMEGRRWRAGLQPDVAEWFANTHGAPTPPQVAALESHERERDVLICSPTGTGKTLAAFLPVLSTLHEAVDARRLADGIQCVYVSPLCALNADLARNLRPALEGVTEVRRARGDAGTEVRVGVRTGDTPRAERDAQTKAPPHILATTPETLAILLNAPRLSLALARVTHIVVDEVHALCGTKRGAHLFLSLARLETLVEKSGRRRPRRIGLSATVAHPERVAEELSSAESCDIAVTPVPRPLRLDVRAPDGLLDATPEEYERSLYGMLHEIVQANASTLVFTRTRAAAERAAVGLRAHSDAYVHALDETDTEDPEFVAPETRDAIATHHGSMSRDARGLVETRLQRAEARCVIASASLELGLDIGHVDHVVLLGSPGDAARALQRIGRSGHRVDAERRATLLALDPDDLAECLALAQHIVDERLPPTPPTPAALDVLAQHLCGEALRGPLRLGAIQRLLQRAGPYRGLTAGRLQATLEGLAEEGLLVIDGARIVRGPRLSRGRYARNVGTIPPQWRARVKHGERVLGTLDARFAESLAAGDVFRLGGDGWRAVRVRAGSVDVLPALGADATIPPWQGEAPGCSPALARDADRIRRNAYLTHGNNGEDLTNTQRAPKIDCDVMQSQGFAVTPHTLSQLCEYRLRQHPDESPGATYSVESFPWGDTSRATVFHLPLGRRANEAIAAALLQEHRPKGDSKPRTLTGDMGIALLSARGDPSPRAAMLRLARRAATEDVFEHAARASPRFKKRLAQVTDRFFLARNMDDRGPPPVAAARQRRHEENRASPVHQEALREVTEEAWDPATAKALLSELAAEPRRLQGEQKRAGPSPFAVRLAVPTEAPPSTAALLARQEAWRHEMDVRDLKRKREKEVQAPRSLGG